MGHEKLIKHHGKQDIRTFRDQFADHSDDYRHEQEVHDLDADSELRFQARHRAPYETYSPYTDEDFGSNAKINNSDYSQNNSDEDLSRPQASVKTYRYDQTSDGTMGGSITFGSRIDGMRKETGRFGGVGPKSYTRSDERIHEEVCEIFTNHSLIDATDVECVVKDGEVTLSGGVPERSMKLLAEQALEHCHGIKEIHNCLKTTSTTTATMNNDELRNS